MKFLMLEDKENLKWSFTDEKGDEHRISVTGAFYDHPWKGLWMYYMGPLSSQKSGTIWVRIAERSFKKLSCGVLESRWVRDDKFGTVGISKHTLSDSGLPPKKLLGRVMREINASPEYYFRLLTEAS
jgi:hypothetical protein